MLDFPTSPSVGQKFPATPIAGIPVYKWDGEKWTTIGGALGGKTDVYTDGSNAMVAQLTLVTPPVNPTDAASKAYVDTRVRYDAAQGLTTAQQQQGRQNVYAAPFDAMGYSGMQVNGAMEVSQEIGTAQLAVGGGRYVVDGWGVYSSGVQTTYGQKIAPSLSGATSALQIQVNPANASPAASDYLFYQHRIEGYRIARLAWGTASAQPITIAFWILAVRPGTYSGSITNNAGNRAYAYTFTINTGSTWEYKVITIPGDTSGVWLTDTSFGLRVNIVMMCGSTNQTAPGAWIGGGFAAATGTINGAAATSDVMQLTGVVVLPGLEAPTSARSLFVMRPFDQEIYTCERYWQKSYTYATAPGAAVGNGNGGEFRSIPNAIATFPVPLTRRMRIGPAVTMYDSVGAISKCSYYDGTGWHNGGPNLVYGVTDRRFTINGTPAAGTQYVDFDWTADARM